MNSTAGETKHNQNPPLMLDFSMKYKDWSKDVSLSLGKQRLDGFEDVGNISLESCKAFLYQFETDRARFL